MLMLVQLHLIGSQAITGNRHLQSPPSRLLLNPGRQGRSSTLHRKISELRTEHEEIKRRCIGKLLKRRLERHLKLL